MAEQRDFIRLVCAEEERAAQQAVPQSPSSMWPAPLGEAAYHGLTGDFVQLIEPHTESDPAALVFQFLTYAGNTFGDKAFFLVEDTRHYPNLFVTVIGATASARKGTSRKRIDRLFREAVPDWEANCVTGGLSTGDGLIARVRDPEYQENKKGETELVHAGAKDKRLLIVEEEFSRPLRAMERSSNTLPSVMRQAWDGDRLSILTREDPIKASGATISIIGHITIDELRAELTDVNAANGFGNRFLWPLVTRSKSLPFGGDECADGIGEIATRLREAIKTSPAGVIRFDELARHRWISVYEGLNEDHPGLYGSLIARSPAQVIRVALIYALVDQQSMIGLAHLEAGLEVVRFSNDSVRHVFGDSTGNRIADTIRQALRSNEDGMTRTEINVELFGRNVKAERINDALAELLAAGKIRRARRDATRGRPSDIFVAV